MPPPKTPRNRGGRPTKLTPEIHQKIRTALLAGNYVEVAAATAGINRDTLYRWLKAGARTRKRSSPEAEFSDMVQKAMADSEAAALAAITSAGMPKTGAGGRTVGSWQALAWRLERMKPEKYGQRQRIDHAGVSGKPIEVAGRIGVYLPAEESDDDYRKARDAPESGEQPQKGQKR